MTLGQVKSVTKKITKKLQLIDYTLEDYFLNIVKTFYINIFKLYKV